MLIIANIRESPASITIYSSKRITSLAYFNVTVFIIRSRKILNLSNDRDLLFELKTLNTLFVYAYIVNIKSNSLVLKSYSLHRDLRFEYYNKLDINSSIVKLLISTSESPKSFIIKEANNSSKIVYSISTDRSIVLEPA